MRYAHLFLAALRLEACTYLDGFLTLSRGEIRVSQLTGCHEEISVGVLLLSVVGVVGHQLLITAGHKLWQVNLLILLSSANSNPIWQLLSVFPLNLNSSIGRIPSTRKVNCGT